MRLEHLCDMELVYREEALYGGKFLLVRPYGGEEGSGYGEGDGSVSGSKLSGRVRWVNHPHRRSVERRNPATTRCVADRREIRGSRKTEPQTL